MNGNRPGSYSKFSPFYLSRARVRKNTALSVSLILTTLPVIRSNCLFNLGNLVVSSISWRKKVINIDAELLKWSLFIILYVGLSIRAFVFNFKSAQLYLVTCLLC